MGRGLWARRRLPPLAAPSLIGDGHKQKEQCQCAHSNPKQVSKTVSSPVFPLPLPPLLASLSPQGDPEPLGAYLPPKGPEAAAPLPDLLISQSQKHPAPQPLFSPSPPLQPPIPRTRQKRGQEAPETPLSSELDPLHAKPKVRPRGSSRMTPSPVSSIALEPHFTLRGGN